MQSVSGMGKLRFKVFLFLVYPSRKCFSEHQTRLQRSCPSATGGAGSVHTCVWLPGIKKKGGIFLHFGLVGFTLTDHVTISCPGCVLPSA